MVTSLLQPSPFPLFEKSGEVSVFLNVINPLLRLPAKSCCPHSTMQRKHALCVMIGLADHAQRWLTPRLCGVGERNEFE
jgi:hypothetical protein